MGRTVHAARSRRIVLVGMLVAGLLGTAPSAAVDLPNDAAGHRHVSGLLDISGHRCGVVVRGANDTGRMTNPATYDYTIPSPLGLAAGNAVDHHWVHDTGAGPVSDAVVLDLDEPSLVVDLFPAIDHGPIPGEALEATVYGFDRLDDPASEWERFRGFADAVAGSRLARTLFLGPWLPTVVGTDTHADDLW